MTELDCTRLIRYAFCYGMESDKGIVAEALYKDAPEYRNTTKIEEDVVEDLVQDLVKLNFYGDAKTLKEIIEVSKKNVDDTRARDKEIKGSFERKPNEGRTHFIIS